MSIMNALAARFMQVVMGKITRPPASLLIAGADLASPELVIVPTGSGPVRVHIYRPKTKLEALPPVYVNFHGGGFIARHPEYDDHLCRALVADTGCVVVNVDYDVAPQRPFPVAANQAFDVMKWVAAHGAEHGWDGSRLALGGQSAGANLTAGACLAARDAGGPQARLQILLYPPLDLAADPSTKIAHHGKSLITPGLCRLFNSAYTPDPATRRDPAASPTFAENLAGLPAAVVITAEYDLLRDEGDAYATRLAQAGVKVTHKMMTGVDHAFTHVKPAAPLLEALKIMTSALNEAWA